MIDLEKIRQETKERIQKLGMSGSAFARKIGVQQGTLSRFLSQKTGLSFEGAMSLLGELGYTLAQTANSPLAKDVCFVNARIVNSEDEAPPIVPEDYLAVPLVSEIGVGTGNISADERILWFLINRKEPSISTLKDPMAVRISTDSMTPTLHPNDIILVDRDNKRVTDGNKIWLVMDPDGLVKIKRVKMDYIPKRHTTRLTFYSDNVTKHPPEAYSLEEDFDDDISLAIVGQAVWAWSDLSRK